MADSIKEWIKEWKEIRGRTLEFLEKVPPEKWGWSPHELLGTFGQQIRHMAVSQRSYINGIKIGKIDFNDKSFNEEVEKDKEKAMNWLKELDSELFNLLEKEDENKEIIFVDGVVGEHTVSLSTVLSYLIEHEFYHQGIFTCYGRIAGLGKFTFM